MFDLNTTIESYDLRIVLVLAIGFGIASILGYFALRLKVSPILGYLLAGYLIGPLSPGFVADGQVSEQLAEIGVILMMFGVGLDFRLQDLIKVKNIAIPGALGQFFISAAITAVVAYLFGWELSTGIILGLAVGVASTVVLVKMLLENHLIRTEEGHISVGWLIVEDIITVVVLLLLPTVATLSQSSSFSFSALLTPLAQLLLKFVLLLCEVESERAHIF